MSILAAYVENNIVQNIIMVREEDFDNEKIQAIPTKTSTDGLLTISLPVTIGMNWVEVSNLQFDDAKLTNYETMLLKTQHSPEVL